MAQDSFIDALLPSGFGRNDRLDRIAALIDWAPVGRLLSKVRPGDAGRPPYDPLVHRPVFPPCRRPVAAGSVAGI